MSEPTRPIPITAITPSDDDGSKRVRLRCPTTGSEATLKGHIRSMIMTSQPFESTECTSIRLSYKRDVDGETFQSEPFEEQTVVTRIEKGQPDGTYTPLGRALTTWEFSLELNEHPSEDKTFGPREGRVVEVPMDLELVDKLIAGLRGRLHSTEVDARIVGPPINMDSLTLDLDDPHSQADPERNKETPFIGGRSLTAYADVPVNLGDGWGNLSGTKPILSVKLTADIKGYDDPLAVNEATPRRTGVPHNEWWRQ